MFRKSSVVHSFKMVDPVLFVLDLTSCIPEISSSFCMIPFSCQVFCYMICRYLRLRVFAYEYFIFLQRVTSPSAEPQFLKDQFVSVSLVSLLCPVQLGRPYQEHKVPAGRACKVIEAHKPCPPPPPPQQGEDIRGSSQNCMHENLVCSPRKQKLKYTEINFFLFCLVRV
jgi:hypothetical protein